MTAVTTRDAPAHVVRTYLDHLAVERGVAANTLSSYRRDLARYVAFLEAQGVTSVGAVASGPVWASLAHRRGGDQGHPPLSAPSAARAVVAVRGLHRFCLRDGLVEVDVAREVRPPQAP